MTRRCAFPVDPPCDRRPAFGWAMCRDHTDRTVLAAFGPHGEPGTATPRAHGASASSGLPAGATPGARKG